MPVIETSRLILDQWSNKDIEAFIAIDQEPAVREFLYPNNIEKQDTLKIVDKIVKHFQEHGFGLYATRLKSENVFIGFVGLDVVSFTAHFTPAVEIGWRLGSLYWGQGYATEAARAVMAYTFDKLALNELVSMTAVENERSRQVMQRIGMVRDPADDFCHPRLPPEHPLSLHVLYRLSREQYYRNQL